MNTKIPTIPIAAAIVTLLAGTVSYAQTVDPGDCNAVRPPVVGPDTNPADTQRKVVPRDSLSDQLATCGSVLNPPAVGDPDVVLPAPAIDDPLAIHPRDPQLKKN
jgi:hypothetical protein